jgi:outer membrane protein TolC
MYTLVRYLVVLSAVFIGLYAGAQPVSNFCSLQQLLSGMKSNYELLKSENSLVQAKQAQKRAVGFDRLPHLNTLFEANVASNNNLEGTYLTYGVIPSVTGGTRPVNNLNIEGGDAAFAGINWEAVNFGAYKARHDLAKSDLLLQMNIMQKQEYDLDGIASAYYLELVRQYELSAIQQDNVTRLQQLKASVTALVSSGTKPGVDSMVAAAELSKALVGSIEARKNYEQIRVQLSTLSGMPVSGLVPDTAGAQRLILEGPSYFFSAPVDSEHHPQVNLYNAYYDYSKARLTLEKKNYYPKLFVDADAWMRGSSLSNSDHFNTDIARGYIPTRFNYMVGLTLTYDIFNIARKQLNTAVYKYQADAAYHRLQNAKANLDNDISQALIEKEFQDSKLSETRHQFYAALSVYTQQLSLYNNGLSSIIELNTAWQYYVQSQRDYLDARVAFMRSIINYSLVTNSFNALVQNLKL